MPVPILLSLLIAGQAVAPGTIVNPAWAQMPAPEYPQAAANAGVTSGSVRLNCAVVADGSLNNCIVVSETPAGAGFGPAAIEGAAHAKLSEATLSTAAPDAHVLLVVQFRLD